ncbi:metallophosphoesterase [Lachnospiraceae bacterium MD1]|jgi:predicted MPP superfamily phosphohydrolase|uniref:Metallophosphoesterase n=1 Tax=Variimorphobacter saccharofermentans TaxID=2755051 RepID=A0A839JZF0_9FIRM|nr:metallophosphoesterase [Variimorphobacter saccharofermentans]MBB2183055.1 metallophosphoesterase [Variimorphobacter saccharofermentans]
MQGFMIVLGIILLLVLLSNIENKRLVTSKYTIVSDKLPKDFHNTRFVLLADLHNNSFGKQNARLIRKIKEINPEFIITAGDMINKRESCCPSNGYSLMKQLSKHYTVYYSLGNHEQRMKQLWELQNTSDTEESVISTWVEYINELSNLGIILLDNQSTYINRKNGKLRITGLSIEPKYFEHNKSPEMPVEYVESLIGKRTDKEFQILVAHNPIYFQTYAAWGADLTLSGHLHGGMVRLPGVGGLVSPQVQLFPKYHSGNHTEEGQHLIVSRGLGSHSIMPRLFNIPEIVVVTLQCEGERSLYEHSC